MEDQTPAGSTVDLSIISEFEESFMPVFPPSWKHIDVQQCILQAEETHRKIRQQLPRGPNYSMRNEANRLKQSLLVLEPMSTWSPKELAGAGLYGTGLNNSSQCFCCGLVMCKQSLSFSPTTNHQKFNPNCGFVQGIESGNISKYDVRLQPPVDLSDNEAMESEEKRLHSFTKWPAYSMIEPTALTQAGFFFTGRRDDVQCFSCRGCLGNWLENDDPWKEHAKWFPECAYLQCMKSEGEIRHYIESYCGFAGFTGSSFTNILDTENQIHKRDREDEIFRHYEDVRALKRELIMIYDDPAFHKSLPFGDSIEMSIDLKSLFADIAVVLKDTKNQRVQQLTLPDILSNLSDITMMEGEAGSGKSALLRKIAILWASGTCPILSRFSLVFYISVSSIDSQQSLSEIIGTQLLGHTIPLREESFCQIIKHLGNQVLFLVDDYSEMDFVPKVVEDLLLRNPSNRLSLAVAVRSGMARKLRQCARTVLRIEEFPLYSTLYLIKSLFSHNIEWLKSFLVTLEMSKSLQATLQTPLVTLALCSYRVQYPDATEVSDAHAFKVYLMYHMKKYPTSVDKVKSLISSCGELALKGLMESCFDFTDDDLGNVGIEGDEAIRFGLLNKYTAQRLRPRYRFFHPSFQEFLAGKRLSELLESERQDDLDKGFHYLNYVDTFLKIVGRYHYFLKYALRNSAKATVNILTHLFSLYDSHKALDCHVDSKEHLQRHPDLEIPEEMLTYILNGLLPLDLDSYKLNLLLTCAVEAGIQCKFLSDCAPKIKEFLTGKMVCYNLNPLSSASDHSLLLFIERYPESVSLLRGIQCKISSNDPRKLPDFSNMSGISDIYGIPSIESDYSSAYLHLDDLIEDKQKKVNETNNVLSLFPQEITISDALIRAFSSLRGHKAPVCQISASCVNLNNFAQSNCEKMKVLFSVSGHIKLKLNSCSDFIQNNWPAIQAHVDSFRECFIEDTPLTAEEQRLVLSMSKLESLQLISTKETPPPDILIRGIDNFTCLNELVINYPTYSNLAEYIPDEFGRLAEMKTFAFSTKDFGDGSSRFADFFKHFANLEVLFLKFQDFPDFIHLLTTIKNCKKLKQLYLSGPSLQDSETACLAETMKNFTSLEVLILERQKITGVDVSERLAVALGSLVHLKTLHLPGGTGLLHAANLVIGQLQNFHNLQTLTMMEMLDDESIALLGKSSKTGYLKRIHKLELQINNKITESGWREFFQTADNLPELSHLNISRIFTHQIKCHATTVTSFVRFVSRLPSVVIILMYGWLLDEGDVKMFNAMKENHPQSKSLGLHFQWVLPFSPKIEN